MISNLKESIYIMMSDVDRRDNQKAPKVTNYQLLPIKTSAHTYNCYLYIPTFVELANSF
jgi:hypothetical protein